MSPNVISVSEVCIQSEFAVHRAWHNSKSLILCYSFLKEVGFPLQWNGLHEVKWIFSFVDLDRKKENKNNKYINKKKEFINTSWCY